MLSKQERLQITDDPALGAGNVLHRLRAYGRSLSDEVLWTDGTWRAPDGSRPRVLTLGRLHEVVETYAGFYHARGVRHRDPVAIHTASSTEFAVNYFALTSLGAIPSFVNSNLRPEIAREYVRRQGAVGALTDEARTSALTGIAPDAGLGTVTAADVTPEHRGHLPEGYPYRHHSSDPIIISHSSGTTGMPKAVPHTHETLLYAQLHRLRLTTGTAMDRLLVALPGSHNAAISVLMLGLLLRAPVMLLSSQRGADVLDAIEEFRPSTVFAFAGTYGEMAAHDLGQRDMSSVQAYYNTGDAAHEAHIRALIAQGSHLEVGRDLVRRRVAGSVFTDGLGSSETGYSIFHNGHKQGKSQYARCVGKPMSFADAAVLAEDGRPLPPGGIGRIGVRSPTLTPGYWNDSLTFHRLRLGGYWLTGDLGYRDEENNFYHLDRAPDAIRTAAGIVFSTRTEELLLRELPGLDDCTVVAVAPEGARVDWDGDALGEAYVLVQAGGDGPDLDDAGWTARVGEVLAAHGFPPVTRALRMDADEVTKGATGKVLKRELRTRFQARFRAGERA